MDRSVERRRLDDAERVQAEEREPLAPSVDHRQLLGLRQVLNRPRGDRRGLVAEPHLERAEAPRRLPTERRAARGAAAAAVHREPLRQAIEDASLGFGADQGAVRGVVLLVNAGDLVRSRTTDAEAERLLA